jgi:tripartite-type tricarboxylate transporter receptor subunit TctC
MTIRRRKFLQLAAAAVACPALTHNGWAQTYPSQPIRFVVGFPPGGGADTVSRIMARWLSERLGQPVVIENKPGASTNLSLQAVASAPPDGYTVVFIGASAAVNVSLFENLPYNLQRDIAPVAGLVDFPFVLIANPKLPATNVAELIAYAKANPGKISMASFGAGSSSHVAGELFKTMAGINLVHVPYRGSAPALTDMLSGQVQVMIDVMTTALPHIQSGALRALAVAGRKRVPGAAGCADDRRYRPRLRGCLVVRRGCAARHAAGDHRAAQSRDQRRAQRPRRQGATRQGLDHADHLHPRRARRLYRVRGREVGQGGADRRRTAGVRRIDRRRRDARRRHLRYPWPAAS